MRTNFARAAALAGMIVLFSPLVAAAQDVPEPVQAVTKVLQLTPDQTAALLQTEPTARAANAALKVNLGMSRASFLLLLSQPSEQTSTRAAKRLASREFSRRLALWNSPSSG